MFNDALLYMRTVDPVFYLYLSVFLVAVLFLVLLFLGRNKGVSADKKVLVDNKSEKSLLRSLSDGLSKTRSVLSGSLDALFQNKSKIDRDLLDSVYETLYKSDMGVSTTEKLVAHLKTASEKKEACDSKFVKKCLGDKVLEILNQTSLPEEKAHNGPHIVLIVGVNGAGKTTSIGKMASKYLEEGKTVALCAGDTYRAAAIAQLQIWGDRLGIKVFAQKEGSDPAAVAFDAVRAVESRGIDVLIVDTAGRLQNKKGLMEELAKVNRAIGKGSPGSPHETVMVLDSTMGQNALQQVSAFSEFVNLTSLVVTKLDGTAKGGVLVALADKFQLPVKYIGIGESVADLKTFVPKDYVDSIFS